MKKDFLEDKNVEIAKLREENYGLHGIIDDQNETIISLRKTNRILEAQLGGRPTEIIAVLNERYDRKTVDEILLAVKCRMC